MDDMDNDYGVIIICFSNHYIIFGDIDFDIVT